MNKPEPIKEEQYAIDSTLYDAPDAPIDGFKGAAKGGINSATVAEWDALAAQNNAKKLLKKSNQSYKFKASDIGLEVTADAKPEHDAVNSPSHYTQGKWEVIEVLEEYFPADPLLFNVGKYILRHNHKGKPLQDLLKAKWYLERKISQLENTIAKQSGMGAQ